MNYEQVDIALGFLEDNKYLVLQVPYAKDIVLVMNYLLEKLKPEIEEYISDSIRLTNGRYIMLQSFNGNEQSGYGVGAGKCFMVDRLNDRSYLDKLEVVESCV